MEGKGSKPFFSLQDGESNISEDENLVKHATDYYKTLFGPGVGNAFDLDHTIWPDEEKVSPRDNYDLDHTIYSVSNEKK
jgi:hypothetical protein